MVLLESAFAIDCVLKPYRSPPRDPRHPVLTAETTTVSERVAPEATEPPEVTVMVPVLDEEDSVIELTERVTAVLDAEGRSFELIFVDDGSRDGTVERIRELHGRDSRVKLVRFRRNFGKAAAITAGVEHSLGRILVTIDGDLQDVPEEIPRFLEKLEAENLDLVSGWKQDRQDPPSKRYPSKLFNWVVRRLAQIDLHDFNCGFKAYRREVLEQVAIYGELHRYIPVLASRRGFRVGELPVAHEKRRHGRSKYGWDRLYKGLLDLITVLFITKYTRRPLHLFGVIGLIFMSIGLGINFYLAVLWFVANSPWVEVQTLLGVGPGFQLSGRPLLLLGVLMMLLGFQTLTTGLLGEMITFKSFRRSDSYSIRERLE
ncbi:MAG: glycosyltransferase family 2 protein [bacterium]|nr:glycosyltransferase family 2 protein [bacterium]